MFYYFFLNHRYARDKGPRVLEFFESYFEIPFPLPKQDMVALPDFAAGRPDNYLLTHVLYNL